MRLKTKYLVLNLVTATVLTVNENKIPNVSDLVKKSDYDAMIKDIENKFGNYNKLMNNILYVKIIAKKLVNESGLNEKIRPLATKEKIKKLAKRQNQMQSKI